MVITVPLKECEQVGQKLDLVKRSNLYMKLCSVNTAVFQRDSALLTASIITNAQSSLNYINNFNTSMLLLSFYHSVVWTHMNTYHGYLAILPACAPDYTL